MDGQNEGEADVLLPRPLVHRPEQPVGKVEDRGQVGKPDVDLVDKLDQVSARRRRQGRDHGKRDGLFPVHQSAPGEPEDGKEGRDPVEQQAQGLHLVNQIREKEPQERDGGEGHAEAEHSRDHGRMNSPIAMMTSAFMHLLSLRLVGSFTSASPGNPVSPFIPSCLRLALPRGLHV